MKRVVIVGALGFAAFCIVVLALWMWASNQGPRVNQGFLRIANEYRAKLPTENRIIIGHKKEYFAADLYRSNPDHSQDFNALIKAMQLMSFEAYLNGPGKTDYHIIGASRKFTVLMDGSLYFEAGENGLCLVTKGNVLDQIKKVLATEQEK